LVSKAIAIDPNRETAYRYSATPLMRQGKNRAGARPLRRSVYFRALQPFRSQRNAAMGRSDEHEYVASARRSSRIETGADGKTTATINVNPLADDGSMAWIGYTATRTEWREKKFAKTFPAEKTYRHTLQEEAEALRSVVKMANELKEKRKLLIRKSKP
jgi:hypothetical protein